EAVIGALINLAVDDLIRLRRLLSRHVWQSNARQRNKPGHPEEESENPHGGEPLTSTPDNHFRFSVCSPQHCNDLSGLFWCGRQALPLDAPMPACRPLRGRNMQIFGIFFSPRESLAVK